MRIRFLVRLSVVLAAAGLGVLPLAGSLPVASAQTPAAGAVAVLSADQESFGSSEDVVVHLTITNPGDSPLAILRWLTPAEGIKAPLFAIRGDGASAAYRGVLMKRAAPTAADYVLLAAGESRTWDINLSAVYDFASSATYAVAYEVASRDLYADADDENLASNTLQMFVAARASRPRAKLLPRTVVGTNGFSGCSSPEQSDVIAARDAASDYAANAVAYLGANTLDSRYITWFGNFDSARYDTVTTHFDNIQDATDNATPMNFDCTCTEEGTFAYVYPDSPYDVYLCPEFWNAPTSGTDSKAGTLIHELSHFDVVAGTDDFVYGQSAAAHLAASNPANAIMNADNHEYFAEDSSPVVTDDAECAPTPVACSAAPKAQLKILDNGDAARRQIQWKWSKGTVDFSDWSDPTADANYRLCFYDGNTLLAAPQVAIESGFLWSLAGSGYKYANAGSNSSGVTSMTLAPGSDRAKIQLKAKGANLSVPALPLLLASDLRVQLVKNAGSGSECWESVFPLADTTSTSTQFRAVLR